MASQVILIDGSHLLHRISYTEAFQKLDKGIIFGFLKSLISIARTYPSSSAIVCWDQGKSLYRTQIDSTYKEWKSSPDEQTQVFLSAYRDNRSELNELLGLFGILSVKINGFEGDDLIAFFRYNTDYKNYIILTEDKDLTQLVDEHTLLHRPINKVIINKKSMEESYPELDPKYTQERFLFEKAMLGDGSDGIDGVYRVGPATAFKIISAYEHGEVHKVLNNPENVERINRNLALMDICEAVSYYHNDLTKAIVPMINGVQTRYLESLQWLQKYKMSTIIQDLDTLLTLNTSVLNINIHKDSYPKKDYSLGGPLNMIHPNKL